MRENEPVDDLPEGWERGGPLREPKPRRRGFPWINLVLFVATVLSTLWVGAQLSVGMGWTPPPSTWGELARSGLPFSASLIGILGAHEMGHFVFARKHRVDASWPYFIPVPFGIGTFGAVIRMRGAIPTRDALIDIGAAGPIAGFVVAVPLLIYGVSLSHIEEIPLSPNLLFGNLSLLKMGIAWIGNSWPPWEAGVLMEPQPLLYLLVKKLVFGVGANQDVFVHPVAFAAVIGLYVTALNLIPIGQLDGGHIAYALFGEKAWKIGKAAAWFILALAFFSSVGWLLWFFAVRRLVGYGHPPVGAEEAPLSPARRVVVALSVLIFFLTLTPVAADWL